MDVAAQLEVIAQALSAILGVWLGLTVGTRSRSPAARVFAMLALVLATWSSSIVLQRLTTSPDAAVPARALEELMAALGLGGIAHFALVIATDGHPSRRQLAVTALTYVILVAFAFPGIVDPGNSLAVAPPHPSLGPIPGAVLGWAWVVARLAALALGAGWLVMAMRTPEPAAAPAATAQGRPGDGRDGRDWSEPAVPARDRRRRSMDRDVLRHARRRMRRLFGLRRRHLLRAGGRVAGIPDVGRGRAPRGRPRGRAGRHRCGEQVICRSRRPVLPRPCAGGRGRPLRSPWCAFRERDHGRWRAGDRTRSAAAGPWRTRPDRATSRGRRTPRARPPDAGPRRDRA